MYASHPISRVQGRRGVILMVVLALLTLFAIIGISFVYYADAESKSSQLDRESQQQFDVDPEMLLNQFLSQFIFDTDNQNGVYSALRGQSLARSMYGYNDTQGALNVGAFNGTGRIHTATLGGM